MRGKAIIRFYVDGFRSMRLGRTLWAVILIKLVVIFAVLRLFFFQPALKGTDEEKGAEVSAALTGRVSRNQPETP